MAAYMKVMVLVAALVAAVSAVEHDHGHDIEYYHPPQYKYEYGVNDGKTHDVKKASEHRDGDKTEGEYVIHDPDGTIRTVKYHVHGKSGFIATVHRAGHAVHPKTVHHIEHH